MIISSVSVYAQNPTIPDAADSVGPREVIYDHWSLLDMKETITDLGGGTWEYSYELTNTDADSIWMFMVWTTFETANPTPFGKSNWSANSIHIDSAYPEYDARNLDPNIIRVSYTWGPDWPCSTNPIEVGENASGFSFTANVYDPSPKYYGYELQCNRAPDTGIVSAVGLTGESGTGIEGHVTDCQTGDPIESALIIAIQRPTRFRTSTDVDGYYNISDLEPGDYWLICFIRGYKLYIGKVEVKDGETTKHDFCMIPK